MDILDICLQDRRNSLAHQKNGWYKDNGIDLVVKMYILLLNSIGFCKPGETVRSKYIFVDEINNSNMRNNLYATRRKFSDAGEQTAFLRFYSVDGEDHLKLNLFQVLLLGISLSLAVIPHIIFSSIFRKNRLEQVLKVLLRIYKKYLNYIGKDKYFVLMSDHHYYSSIVAMTNTEKSMVIQHGLVMDKRFYYPIRAGHFCAWGNHSKILLDNDEKVVVLGTYKFDGITGVPSEKNFKKILFCVGSLDTESF